MDNELDCRGVKPTIMLRRSHVESLIKHINRKYWWYVLPSDPNAYRKRGKFYSSSYAEAEFYGKPCDPERVTVQSPLIGDNSHVEMTLFGCCPSDELDKLKSGLQVITARLKLDARMKKAAIHQGYDAIVLVTPNAWKAFLETNKLPKSVELNVFV